MSEELLPLFQALADPTRLKILEMVRVREQAAGEIASQFTVTRTAVSQHLTLLRRAGLISERRDGTRRLYRLAPDPVSSASDWLAGLVNGVQRSETPATGIDDGIVPLQGDEPENLLQPGVAQELPRPAPPIPARRHPGEVVLETTINAPANRVFALLCKEAGLRAWLARTVEVETRPGGHIRLSNQAGVHIEGWFKTFAPPQRLGFSWGGLDGLEPGESEVEFDIEPAGDAVRLKVRHHNLPRKTVPNYRNLWRHSALPRLTAVAEGRAVDGVVLEPPEG